MQLIPNAKQQFIDQNGLPLAGGSVGFYYPGTLDPKPTYLDPAGAAANTNPVLLDSRGQAVIWGLGVYRQIVKDSNGVTIWDQVTEDANAGLIGNITDAVFVAGTDFTPGTTTALTLPVAPGSIPNMWIYFDAAHQGDDQIASLVDKTITFTSAIPVGVSRVFVKIGMTIALGTPGSATVTDDTVAATAAIQSTKLSFLQAGAGAVSRTVQSKLRQWVDAVDFGADATGVTDCATAIANAVASLPSSGGEIYFPPGSYSMTAFPDLTNKTCIRIYGAGGQTAGATSTSSILINKVSPGAFINAPGSVSLGIDGIQFVTKQAGFTDYIISLGSSPANSAFARIKRCGFFAASGVRYIAKGINLDKTIEAEIDSCSFGSLLFAIAGASNTGFSNAIKISGCQFVDTSQIPIQGGGQAWQVVGNTFECYNGGTPGNALAGAMANFPSNPFGGLSFSGNWLGDVTTAGGTWLNLSGGGIDISGNFIGGGSGSNAIALASVDSANIEGNAFNTFTGAVAFGSGNGPNIFVGPNEYIGVTNRLVSTSNWPGYSGSILYEPLSNTKMQLRGTATASVGSAVGVTFPISLGAAPETILLSFASSPGSVTAIWSLSAGTGGFSIGSSGSGTASVNWLAIGPMPG